MPKVLTLRDYVKQDSVPPLYTSFHSWKPRSQATELTLVPALLICLVLLLLLLLLQLLLLILLLLYAFPGHRRPLSSSSIV